MTESYSCSDGPLPESEVEWYRRMRRQGMDCRQAFLGCFIAAGMSKSFNSVVHGKLNEQRE